MSTIYVTTQGATVQKRTGQFVVTKSDSVLQNVPETHVRQLVLLGNINLTTPAVTYCLENRVEVVFLSQGGRFRGRLNTDSGRAVELRRSQYDRAGDAAFCLNLAKRLVRGKIANQLAVARRIFRNGKFPTEVGNLQKLIGRAGLTTSIPMLLGIEGSASATYFRMFGSWLPAPFEFTKRISNPPADEINALLSLAYTLLYNRVRSNLEAVGLDAYLGFMHQPKNGHAALASDLVEEFRPAIGDSLVLKLIRRKQIVPTHFQRINGRIRLTDEGGRIFFREFEEKMASKRQSNAGGGWQLSYSQILERQARHLARVIGGQEEEYQPFELK